MPAPAHEPSACAHEPSPRAHGSLCARDVSEEETQQLKSIAERNNFAVPTTSEEAEIFMQAIMGLKLWESDGVGRGETKGEIVGYNTINGSNYGGSDEPLPPGARAVFAIFKDGWQTVPATKGKRVRGS